MNQVEKRVDVLIRILNFTHAHPALRAPPWAQTTHSLINDIGLSRHTTRGIRLALPAPESLRLHLDHRLDAHRPIRSRIGITSLNLPTQLDPLLLEQKSASKSTPLHSSVLSALKSSLVLTISDRTFALTRTSDLSCARCVAKLLLVNMTARGTRVCTAGKRSSFAAASWEQAAVGDAVEDSLERTLLAGTSEAKLAECASSHYSTKRRWSGSVFLTSR